MSDENSPILLPPSELPAETLAAAGIELKEAAPVAPHVGLRPINTYLPAGVGEALDDAIESELARYQLELEQCASGTEVLAFYSQKCAGLLARKAFHAARMLTRERDVEVDHRLDRHKEHLATLEKKAKQVGPQGEPGPPGPMPAHRWEGTKLQFEQGPNGDAWGKAVDLQGPPGNAGFAGGGMGAGPLIVQSNGYFPQGWT